MHLTIEELKQTYTNYNEDYFDGELPAVDEVTIEYSGRMTASAGICYPGRKIIRISTHYANKHGRHEIKKVLLHEMIHLIIPNHSQDFYDKMDEVRARGGEVERFSLGRASVRWEYECPNCDITWKRSRRLGGGCICGRCESKLREWRLV